jgi:YebC/PmpR family DNA-binding regulatory protein
MSGHSKWHNIQKTKGAQDAKRAAAFTKISKEMIVAVKEGGGITDPLYNSRLATAITKAKAANMPNDNIKRVLEKAAAAGSGDSYETITYEGHGPSGVSVIVETMTDNRNRTAGNVRHHFDKFGGVLGTTGCVSWMFDRKGVIVIDNEEGELTEDNVMMDALDAGAADFEPEEDCFTVYTEPDDFNAVAKALEDKGYTFESAQIEMVPQNYIKLEKPEDIDNMEKMLDLFEDDDDVQNVWHNWEQD